MRHDGRCEPDASSQQQLFAATWCRIMVPAAHRYLEGLRAMLLRNRSDPKLEGEPKINIADDSIERSKLVIDASMQLICNVGETRHSANGSGRPSVIIKRDEGHN